MLNACIEYFRFLMNKMITFPQSLSQNDGRSHYVSNMISFSMKNDSFSLLPHQIEYPLNLRSGFKWESFCQESNFSMFKFASRLQVFVRTPCNSIAHILAKWNRIERNV